MDRVLEKLIIADEQAQKLLDTEKEKNENARKQASNNSIEVQNKYMKNARIHIEAAKEDDLKKAKADLLKYENEFDGLQKKINDAYKSYGEDWVKKIVNRAINELESNEGSA